MKGLMVRCVIAASVCGVLACAATASPAKRATVTVSGYSGTTELTNFPVLVRISADRISGFSYSDCDIGGSDLSFVDADGAALAHEIDTWNEDGESLVWVNVQVVTNNASFVMRWCDDDPPTTAASDTWNSDYVGVWHMGESVGVCANSTSHGSKYDATPMGRTANSKRYDGSDAPVGGARTTATSGNTKKGYLSIPSYDAEGVGDSFTMSGWVRLDSCTGYPRIFARKDVYNSSDGWEMEMVSYSFTAFNARGASQSGIQNKPLPSLEKAWVHVALVYNGALLKVYGNGGETEASASIAAATDNGKPLSIGCNSNGSEAFVAGQFDECRLKKGAASADWVKAEYDTVKGDAFITFGEVSDLAPGGGRPRMGGFAAVNSGDSYATVSNVVFSLGDGASSATLLCNYGMTADDLGAAVSSEVTSVGRQTLTLTRLVPGTTYYARLTLKNNLGVSIAGKVFEISTTPSNDTPSDAVGLNQTFFTSANADWTKDYLTLSPGTEWTHYEDDDRVYRRELGPIMAYVYGDPTKEKAKYTSEVWGDEVYWPVNGGQWAYWGYMYMEKGKIYQFRSKIDDTERLVVTNIVTGAGIALLDDSDNSDAAITSGSFVPTATGWYPIEVRLADNSAKAGGYDASDNYRNAINLGYSSDGGYTWDLLLDPGDGSLLRTTAPSSEAASIAVEETTIEKKVALRLTFAAAESKRSLVAAWGSRRGYGTTNDWANCAFAGEIAAGETGFTYVLPDDWGTDENLVVRFCLAEDGKLPVWSATTYWHKTARRGMQLILR